MAKGQMRSNREQKKPKKIKPNRSLQLCRSGAGKEGQPCPKSSLLHEPPYGGCIY